MRQLPIGVFDSGVGGLTVLKALQALLPHESFVYLGDTARLPYGTKSPQTVVSYALGASQLLFKHQAIKLLVIACNTASTLAYEALCAAHPDLTIIDVVRPGAQAAVANTKCGDIAVIATEATVNSGGYQREIKARLHSARVRAESAGLLVALAEEGWVDNDVAISAIKRYLYPLLTTSESFNPDCLLLGCTHFPTLLPAISQVVTNDIVIVDSASAAAASVKQALTEQDLLTSHHGEGEVRYLVTDLPERFLRVAARFLGKKIQAGAVELVSF